MGKTWYFRMLMSYLPVFFVVTLLLLFLYYFALNEQNEKQMRETQSFIGTEIMRLVDTELQDINHTLSRGSVYNKEWRQFFFDASRDFNNYSAFLRMHDAMVAHRLIEAIFLVNFKDGAVLGSTRPYTLEQFERYGYLEQFRLEGNSSRWSSAYDSEPAEGGAAGGKRRMVSLYKRVGATDNEGLIIVNVNVDNLKALVRQSYDLDGLGVTVVDRADGVVFDNGANAAVDGGGETPANGGRAGGGAQGLTVELQSPVTGWTFRIGHDRGTVYGLSFILSHVGLLFALLAIAAGAVLIVLMTRLLYRPIRQIRMRLFHTPDGEAPSQGKRLNEVDWIQTVLDRVIAHSRQYRNLYLTEQVARTQYEIREMLEGSRAYDPALWQALRERFELPAAAGGSCVIRCLLIEIDDARRFAAAYSVKDQELLRFVLLNVVRETAAARARAVYTDWVNEERLFALLYAERSQDGGAEHCAQSIVEWVSEHLQFTVTIGVGEEAASEKAAAASYRGAKEALSCKMTLGNNRAIAVSDVRVRADKELYDPVTQIVQISKDVLQGKSDWERKLTTLTAMMREQAMTREDVVNLFQYLVYQVQKGLARHYEPAALKWKAGELPRLEMTLQTEESLDALGEALLQAIRPLCSDIAELQRSARHYELMQQVKEHIERHYADDTLSLESLSDHFGINDKYLSKLFKETIGINFGEFVSRIRLERAKHLLLQTSASVQDIGQQVGYGNSITFSRVFKRTLGMTPSEYRQRKAEGGM